MNKPSQLVQETRPSTQPLEVGWGFTFLTAKGAVGTMKHPSLYKQAPEEEAKAGLSMLKYQK